MVNLLLIVKVKECHVPAKNNGVSCSNRIKTLPIIFDHEKKDNRRCDQENDIEYPGLSDLIGINIWCDT